MPPRFFSAFLCSACLALATSATTACGDKGAATTASYPNSLEGAIALTQAARKATDARAFTLALKPSRADYEAVFTGDMAAQYAAGYDALWNDPQAAITAKPEQTQVLVYKATVEQLQSGQAADFPGAYKDVAGHFKPGHTIYRWKYTLPGESLGMAYDGLIHVNGHWAWFPKPWRALKAR